MPMALAMAADSRMVSALTTRRKNPSVTTMQPHESRVRTGLMKAFTKLRMAAITATAIQALPSTLMPGSTASATSSAAKVMSQRMNA